MRYYSNSLCAGELESDTLLSSIMTVTEYRFGKNDSNILQG